MGPLSCFTVLLVCFHAGNAATTARKDNVFLDVGLMSLRTLASDLFTLPGYCQEFFARTDYDGIRNAMAKYVRIDSMMKFLALFGRDGTCSEIFLASCHKGFLSGVHLPALLEINEGWRDYPPVIRFKIMEKTGCLDLIDDWGVVDEDHAKYLSGVPIERIKNWTTFRPQVLLFLMEHQKRFHGLSRLEEVVPDHLIAIWRHPAFYTHEMAWNIFDLAFIDTILGLNKSNDSQPSSSEKIWPSPFMVIVLAKYLTLVMRCPGNERWYPVVAARTFALLERLPAAFGDHFESVVAVWSKIDAVSELGPAVGKAVGWTALLGITWRLPEIIQKLVGLAEVEIKSKLDLESAAKDLASIDLPHAGPEMIKTWVQDLYQVAGDRKPVAFVDVLNGAHKTMLDGIFEKNSLSKLKDFDPFAFSNYYRFCNRFIEYKDDRFRCHNGIEALLDTNTKNTFSVYHRLDVLELTFAEDPAVVGELIAQRTYISNIPITYGGNIVTALRDCNPFALLADEVKFIFKHRYAIDLGGPARYGVGKAFEALVGPRAFSENDADDVSADKNSIGFLEHGLEGYRPTFGLNRKIGRLIGSIFGAAHKLGMQFEHPLDPKFVELCFSSTREQRRQYFLKEYQIELEELAKKYYVTETSKKYEKIEDFLVAEYGVDTARYYLDAEDGVRLVKAESLQFTDFKVDASKQGYQDDTENGFALTPNVTLQQLHELHHEVSRRLFEEFDALIRDINEALRSSLNLRHIDLLRDKSLLAKIFHFKTSGRESFFNGVSPRYRGEPCTRERLNDIKIPSLFKDKMISLQEAMISIVLGLSDEKFKDLVRGWSGSLVNADLKIDVYPLEVAGNPYVTDVNDELHEEIFLHTAKAQAHILGLSDYSKNDLVPMFKGAGRPLSSSTCAKTLTVVYDPKGGSAALVRSVTYFLSLDATNFDG